MSDTSPIAVVDYGMGNVASVVNMLRHLDIEATTAASPDEIRTAARIILPGVGAFDAGMEALRQRRLDSAIRDAAEGSTYVLGVCLGLHLLCGRSEEGERPGLGLIEADVRRFQFEERSLRVPHMGWNVVQPVPDSVLFDPDIREHRFYFAHSYYVDCSDPAAVAATCSYGFEFPCAVEVGRVMGVQFHPEKSHQFGMNLLERFASLRC